MKEIYAFGDSVLKGIILDNDKYKVSKNSFSNICKNTLGVSIVNKAKFGSTVNTGDKSLSKNLNNAKDADYIIFEFGGNDCDFNWAEISQDPEKEHKPNSTIQDFRKIYTKLIDQGKKIAKQVVLLSLPPIDAKNYFSKISEGLNPKNILKWMNNNVQFISDWHERYNLETFKMAIQNKVAIIDVTSRFLEHSDYSKFLCDDGIHPNEQGHMIIAEAIKEHVESRNIEL